MTFWFFQAVFLGWLVVRMYSLQDDEMSSYRLINDIENHKQLNMTDLDFLPNYDIKTTRDEYFEDLAKDILVNGSQWNSTFSDSLDIDLEKFSQYIKFLTHIRVRNKTNNNKTDYYLEVPMVKCKREWFKNIEVDLSSTRICPDLDSIPKEFWIVKGNYESNDERISFSSNVIICDKNLSSNCKNESEINKLLKAIYFTEYLVQRKSNIVNRKMKPIIYVNTFQ